MCGGERVSERERMYGSVRARESVGERERECLRESVWERE